MSEWQNSRDALNFVMKNGHDYGGKHSRNTQKLPLGPRADCDDILKLQRGLENLQEGIHEASIYIYSGREDHEAGRPIAPRPDT